MLIQISASAGSGKTYTLTTHFLSLLQTFRPGPALQGCLTAPDPEAHTLQEILAATFTNKAAAEMKTRVLGSLKRQALEELAGRAVPAPGTTPARVWVTAILRHYSSLNIRTIDSLLTALVRLSALELGLPPDFEPAFAPETWFDPLYDGLMEDLARRGPDRAVFFTADASALRAALEDACRSLLFLSPLRGFSHKGRLRGQLCELVERLLAGKPVPCPDVAGLHERLNALHEACSGAARDLAALLAREELAAARPFLGFLERCAACSAPRELPDSAYLAREDLDACLNKAAKGRASALCQQTFERLRVSRAAYAAELPLLKSALQLAPLALLAEELRARAVAAMRSSRQVPAVGIPSLAAQVLQAEHGVSDSLCRMGARLAHILLDEFQDTSRDQWRAVLPLAAECLSRGGSLTYVGDVKQAIYSWRGGEARLFHEALEEPELRAMVPVPERRSLPCNWRSSPAVVRHNNAFFRLLADPACARAALQAMLPEHTPPAYLEQAVDTVCRVFADVEQDLPPGRPDPREGRVRLYTVEGEHAQEVDALVRARLERLLADDLLPRWRRGDITVLVRSGSEAETVAGWLTDWGLPVVTEDSFLLADHPLVRRLIDLLAFLDYPLDDVAFWSFVSGPECLCRAAGLDAAELRDWLCAATAGQRRTPLFRLFRDRWPDAWDLWLAPFYNQAGLMSAYDTLMEAARHYGLATAYPDQEPFIQRLLEVAHQAEAQGYASLAAFLGFWQARGRAERVPLPESMDAVRIMTIHKAKGLEFPVVIVPFHHRDRRHDGGYAVAHLAGQQALARAGKELPHIYYPACVTDDLERLNLLYVAWTRPVRELHAFLTRPRTALAASPLARGLSVLADLYRERAPDVCAWESILPPAEPDPAAAAADAARRTRTRPGDNGPLAPPLSAAPPVTTGAPAAPAVPGSAPECAPDASSSPKNRFPHHPLAGHTASAVLSGQNPLAEPAPKSCPSPDGRPAATARSGLPFGEPAGAPGVNGPDFFPDHTAAQSAGAVPYSPRAHAGSVGPSACSDPFETPLPGSDPDALPPSAGREWRPMAWLPRLRVYRSTLERPEFTPRRRGILLHLCLEFLPLSGPGETEADVRAAVRQGMRRFPLPLADPGQVAREMEDCLAWFVSLPDAPLWLAHGRREQAVMDRDGSLHRLDLLVDAPGRDLQILDYKTGRETPGHDEQVRRYMRLLSDSRDRNVRGLLVYFDARVLREVRL